MSLKSLVAKSLSAYFRRIIKRSELPEERISDDRHRPSNCSTTALAVNPTFDVDSSPSTSDYDGDAEAEIDGGSTLDLSSIYDSARFFVSYPGISSSILHSSASSTTAAVEVVGLDIQDSGGRGDVVEVLTESPDPYSDFRRSMEEMVEARELHDVPANWKSLQELLFRYLSLNPETNHKFIAGAFADVLVTLMSPAPSSSEEDVSGEAPAAAASCSCY